MQETRPRLTKGRHKTAGHEACVMELVSLLNDEEWSDHPRCVQPVLAAVARAVNDRVSDAGREGLVALAPRLAGTAAADWLVGARLVELCTETALKAAETPATPQAPGAAPRAPMPHEVWQELTAARRTARYLLCRNTQGERTRCSWPVRAVIWLLDRTRLLNRAYTYDAALQAAFAVAQIDAAGGDSEPELLALLNSCVEECARPKPRS
jgi:hypothetical protein